MKRLARLAGIALLALSALGLVAGYGGALHPAGDSLALLRLPLALICALLALALRWPRRLVWPVGAVALASLVGLAMTKLPQPEGEGIVIQHRNLWVWNPVSDEMEAELRDSGADVVTLSEVAPRNEALLARLGDLYPYQHYCPGRWGQAVLSRFPGTGNTLCSEGRGIAAMQVDGPEGPFWVAGIHLHWPWPHEQADQVEDLMPYLEQMEGPVIVGGDFNMVPWSHAVRRIARATRTARVGPLFPTIYPGGIPLPIDYILAPGPGTAWRRPQVGSDHFGVQARVSLAP